MTDQGAVPEFGDSERPHDGEANEQDGAEDSQSESTEDAEPTTRTGAESVVASLETAGVDTVFGVQGGAIMPVYDALYDSDLGHVTMAHEQGAAHAADAYGSVTGKPGICMATSGPGRRTSSPASPTPTWTPSRSSR